MATSGTRFVDKLKFVRALHAVVPSSSTPKWVSLKGYGHATVIVGFKNATTVTGAAIGLQQATAVAGTSAKALGFTQVWGNSDDSASVALTNNAVVSNTFTPDNTNSKSGFYIIEVRAEDLDMANGFDCFQATTGNGVAQTITIDYLLGAPARYAGESGSFMNPLAD